MAIAAFASSALTALPSSAVGAGGGMAARTSLLRQLRDFLHQPDHADHQPDLRCSRNPRRCCCSRGRCRPASSASPPCSPRPRNPRPTDAAGEIPDLAHDLAGNFAVDPPFQVFVTRGGKLTSSTSTSSACVSARNSTRSGRSACSPKRTQLVQPFAEGQRAGLLHHRQVGGVVDGELDRVAAREA